MKPNQLFRVFTISLIIAFFISVINFWYQDNVFVPGAELVTLAINFMFAFTLTAVNSWFFKYIDRFYTWSEQPTYRFLLGAFGSVALTVLCLFMLQAITSMGFYGNSWDFFIERQHKELYIGGIIITMIVAVSFHAVYFYKELQTRKVQEQRVIATSATAQFDALKSQLDPHFLFNSLNVLVSLIEENPDAAVTFTTSLSKVYRYVLEQRNKSLVSVDEELDFARTYVNLLKMRFEDSMEVSIPQQAANTSLKVVPLSLQLLIENAVKHNVVSTSKPLQLRIYEKNNTLVVENNLQAKNVVHNSSGVGLQNIAQRYALLSDRKMNIEKTGSHFKVSVPLLLETDLKPNLNNNTMTTIQEMKVVQARQQVADLKEFYHNIIKTIIIISLLGIVNYFTTSFPWVLFPLAGMSISLLFQYLKVSNSNIVLGRRWEQNKIETLMNDPKF
ncbi:MAG: histidine kinase [Nonlabens sp.]|nr:histidine kinase [Nonlabens sp.]